ncbi:sensor histidine kinase [Longitalea luteola]|uniref:sensor histidine kinase n=1 Tax=Longitalea luteola TaxID=2812563 RepID=UPI001A97A8BE|nr:HAMP domain-containing histidine kinase [Longitalea luteola]
MKSLIQLPQPVPSTQTVVTEPVPLHRLIDQLMVGLLPLVTGKKSFIINDVDQTFQVQADENLLAYVLGNLLSGAINGTENVCIRVEAVCNKEGVHVRVRNNGTYFYSTVSNGFSHVVQAARQLGGNISIYNQHNEGTTLTFSMATPVKTFC